MDSDLDIRYLFETNIVPTKEETTHIRLLLDKDLEEIHPLETQITQLQDTLQLLILEHEERRARIRAKEGILSAIRRIPPEIVGQIFVRCLRDYLRTDDDGYQEYYPDSDFPPVSCFGPLVLTHICSGWRQVAVTLPQLWSQITLDFDDIHLLRRRRAQSNPNSLRLADFARFWISCASNVPLTVSFKCQNVFGYDSDLAHIVMNPANRFKEIIMQCPEQMILEYLSSMTGVSGDLEFVYLYGSEVSAPQPQWTHTLPIFNLSPKLRRLSIHSLTYRILNIFAMCWGQLTELSLSFGRRELEFTPSRCHTILRQCMNLVALKVYMVGEPWDVTNAHLPTTAMQHMRKLEKLEVFPINGHSSLDSFYTPLVLPALKDLSVRGHRIQSLVALISRSSCNLERLKCFPRQSPEELLVRVPSLIELHIDIEFFNERILQGISHFELVPTLEILQIILPDAMWTTPTTGFFEAISGIVKSRWWPGSTSWKSLNGIMVSRLKRVEFPFGMDRICASVPWTQPLLKLLDQCKREGLEIKNCPIPDAAQEVEDNEDEDTDMDTDENEDEDEDEDGDDV